MNWERFGLGSLMVFVTQAAVAGTLFAFAVGPVASEEWASHDFVLKAR